MAPRLAPVLHELAGRLAGRPVGDARAEPMHWAYALRDAAGLAHPDVLISHWDSELEADALRDGMTGGDGDWVDRLLAAPPLAEAAPTRACVELVSTLSGLFHGRPEIGATVTGPGTTAAGLAPALLLDDASSPDDRIELADLCADALAGLIGAYGEAGASLVIVVESDAEFLDPADLLEAQSPLARALAHHRVEGVFVAPAGLDADAVGYGATAHRWDGSGPAPAVALVPADVWALPPAEFAERWPPLAAAAGTSLLISDGPLPASMPLENLQAARAAPA